MKAGLPAKAAQLALSQEELSTMTDLLDRIAVALLRAGLYEKVRNDRVDLRSRSSKGFRLGTCSSKLEITKRHLKRLEKGRLIDEVCAGVFFWRFFVLNEPHLLLAVELSRSAFPNDVVSLEDEWGDYLASQKQYDSAISHFIEAG